MNITPNVTDNNRNRQPKGLPVGGQYATEPRNEYPNPLNKHTAPGTIINIDDQEAEHMRNHLKYIAPPVLALTLLAGCARNNQTPVPAPTDGPSVSAPAETREPVESPGVVETPGDNEPSPTVSEQPAVPVVEVLNGQEFTAETVPSADELPADVGIYVTTDGRHVVVSHDEPLPQNVVDDANDETLGIRAQLGGATSQEEMDELKRITDELRDTSGREVVFVTGGHKRGDGTLMWGSSLLEPGVPQGTDTAEEYAAAITTYLKNAKGIDNPEVIILWDTHPN